jgi:ribosomal protein S18 acetylase RimI-like enzyme
MEIRPQDFEAVVGMGVTVLKKNPTKVLGLLKRCLPGGPRDHAAVVVENEDGIVGYAIYRHSGEAEIKIKQLAVTPHCRREGAGRTALNWIIDCYAASKRSIVADVSENNFAAQKLFSSVGFKAQLVRNSRDDGDKYRFSYKTAEDKAQKEKV